MDTEGVDGLRVWKGISVWGRATRPSPLIASKSDFFADALRLREKIQVIRPAGFRIRPRHIEPAEWVRTHDSAGTFAVDIEIAHVEVALGALDFLR